DPDHHPFPTRRSSDLKNHKSPSNSTSCVFIGRETSPSSVAVVNIATSMPFIKSLNVSISSCFIMLHHLFHRYSILYTNLLCRLRSEEHTSELQSRENL